LYAADPEAEALAKRSKKEYDRKRAEKKKAEKENEIIGEQQIRNLSSILSYFLSTQLLWSRRSPDQHHHKIQTLTRRTSKRGIDDERCSNKKIFLLFFH
jgi:hypothetical protein